MSDFTLSSLTQIRKKVRRLTRNPSVNQISNSEIDDYINNFVLYDFPALVMQDKLKTTFTFFTEPGIREYHSVIGPLNITKQFYHFNDYYINVIAPVYIAGNLGNFTQSKEEFYSMYSLSETEFTLGTGNGINTIFTGTLIAPPVVKYYVTVTSKNNGSQLLLEDNGKGDLKGDTGGASTVDYNTGAISVQFNNPPDNGESVTVRYVPYVPGRPDTILYYNGSIFLGPVPDDSYRVELTVIKRPSELLNIPIVTPMPELSQWWQYIAYGASIKILQDRGDQETVAKLEPEFYRQEILINRRTILQNSGRRASTIFAPTFNSGDE